MSACVSATKRSGTQRTNPMQEERMRQLGVANSATVLRSPSKPRATPTPDLVEIF